MTLKLFLKRTAPFSILWTLTNYLYLLALRKLTATDVSALYCCHKAFVFLLSWIVLKDRFMGVRVSAETSELPSELCVFVGGAVHFFLPVSLIFIHLYR